MQHVKIMIRIQTRAVFNFACAHTHTHTHTQKNVQISISQNTSFSRKERILVFMPSQHCFPNSKWSKKCDTQTRLVKLLIVLHGLFFACL